MPPVTVTVYSKDQADVLLAGKVDKTRKVAAGTGLTGGGDLSTDRTLAVAYGSTAGTAVQGNDARVTADQVPATASVRTLGGGAQQAAPGDHVHSGDQVAFTGDGIAASNVQDAVNEVFAHAEDAGNFCASSDLPLNLTAGVFVTDADLNTPLAANEAVWLDYHLIFSGPTTATANLRANFSYPAGATASWGSALDWNAAGSSGAAKGALAAETDTRTFKLASGVTGIHITVLFENGATPGVIALNLAPDTTTASAVVRKKRSRVEYATAS